MPEVPFDSSAFPHITVSELLPKHPGIFRPLCNLGLYVQCANMLLLKSDNKGSHLWLVRPPISRCEDCQFHKSHRGHEHK